MTPRVITKDLPSSTFTKVDHPLIGEIGLDAAFVFCFLRDWIESTLEKEVYSSVEIIRKRLGLEKRFRLNRALHFLVKAQYLKRETTYTDVGFRTSFWSLGPAWTPAPVPVKVSKKAATSSKKTAAVSSAKTAPPDDSSDNSDGGATSSEGRSTILLLDYNKLREEGAPPQPPVSSSLSNQKHGAPPHTPVTDLSPVAKFKTQLAEATTINRQSMTANPRQAVTKFLALTNALRNITGHSQLDLDVDKTEKTFKAMLQSTCDQDITLAKLVIIYACLMRLDVEVPVERVPYCEGTKVWVTDAVGSHLRRATYVFSSFFKNISEIRNTLVRYNMTSLSEALSGLGV